MSWTKSVKQLAFVATSPCLAFQALRGMQGPGALSCASAASRAQRPPTPTPNTTKQQRRKHFIAPGMSAIACGWLHCGVVAPTVAHHKRSRCAARRGPPHGGSFLPTHPVLHACLLASWQARKGMDHGTHSGQVRSGSPMHASAQHQAAAASGEGCGHARVELRSA